MTGLRDRASFRGSGHITPQGIHLTPQGVLACEIEAHPASFDKIIHLPSLLFTTDTDDSLMNLWFSKLNTHVNATTCLGDTDCLIQQVTAPTLVVPWWIQQSVCILPSTCTRGAMPPLSDWNVKCAPTVGSNKSLPEYHNWCSDLLDPTVCITQASCWIHLCI